MFMLAAVSECEKEKITGAESVVIVVSLILGAISAGVVKNFFASRCCDFTPMASIQNKGICRNEPHERGKSLENQTKQLSTNGDCVRISMGSKVHFKPPSSKKLC